jgi:hypothetical protein
MLVTAAQLGVYDAAKSAVIDLNLMKDGLATHFTCSFGAGFVAAVVTSPVDVVKTRLMSQSKSSTLGVQYSGFLDCFVKVSKTEGIRGLYKV